MKKLMALLAGIVAFQAFGSSYEKVPLISLIVRPADFHQKKVEVNGFWDASTSTSTLLFASKEFQENKMIEYSIRLGRQFEAEIPRKNSQLVKVFGVFHYELCSDCKYKYILRLENAKTMERMLLKPRNVKKT
jgi:hypothetical protein